MRSTGAKLLRKMTRKKPAELPEAASEWSAEQLAEVREIALKRAIDLGMKPAKAETLADAVVGALVRRS
jgi:hypothetical protein